MVLGTAQADKLDTQLLAQYACVLGLSATVVGDEPTRQLAALVTRRRQLVEAQVAEKNRLTRAAQAIQPNIQAHIDYLDQQIDRLDEQVDALGDHRLPKRLTILNAMMRDNKSWDPLEEETT